MGLLISAKFKIVEIQIKKNDALITLSSSVVLSVKETESRIVNYIKQNSEQEIEDLCGYSIEEICKKESFSPKKILKSCFYIHLENTEAYEFLKAVLIWGTECSNPCPDCGCETVEDPQGMNGHEWIDIECSNCEYSDSNEPDWDILPGGHDDI